MPFRRAGMRRMRVVTRRVVALTLLAVVVMREQNKVQVTTQEQGVQTCDLIKYKDGTEGFVMGETFYDTNKNVRDLSEVA